MQVDRYDGIPSYLDAVKSLEQRFIGHYRDRRSLGREWDGGIGYEQAMQFSRDGDPSLVGKYADKVDQLVRDFKMHEGERNAYLPSVAGSRVSVPDYLGGNPMCMGHQIGRRPSRAGRVARRSPSPGKSGCIPRRATAQAARRASARRC